MTFNQEKNEPITPQEVREIIAYLNMHREATAPFDVAVNGVTLDNTPQDTEVIQQFSDAGATWWIEYEASRATFKEYRARILLGPPKIA